MSNVIAVLGSSRKNGNTQKVLEAVLSACPAQFIDLSDLRISSYRYDYKTLNDDFFPLSEQLTKADKIILATPVYWYAMSAQMKTFIDRFSDLITRRKPVGRALAGRQLYVVSTGYDEVLPNGFEVPFSRTAEYFAMRWGGTFYAQVIADVTTENMETAEVFGRAILDSK